MGARRRDRKVGVEVGATRFVALVVAMVLAPGAAHADVVAEWRMDEAAGARTMVDSVTSGVRNDGQIVSVETGVPGLAGGTAYRFSSSGAYVSVPDSDELDPGGRRIAVTAVVQIPDRPMRDDSYDIVRKGYATTPGGDWKMEVKRTSNASVGRLSCVFSGILGSGSRSTVVRTAKTDVVDGRVHRLQCIRDGSTVQAVVDGVVTQKGSQATGSIANSSSVLVGAKQPGDDVLLGVLDQVTVDIG